jgi:hypothetical protein
MSKVACVLPTRGLIYAKTIKGMLENVVQNNAALVIVEGKPMPDCFNDGVEEALSLGASHIWFLEEDNEAPSGVLKAMLDANKPIVTIDYPVAKERSVIHKDKDGKVLWCGLGCTLIRREVFDNIPKPWFEVNKLFNQNGDVIDIPQEKVAKSWGGHDVLFFNTKIKDDITVLPIRGEHYRALELPKREMNSGCYTIKSL